MAMLAHALQALVWWIGPLIIFLIRRDSRFVSFHALQALFLQIVCLIFMAGSAVLWFVAMFLLVAHHGGPNNATQPLAIFLMFPLIWLGLVLMFVLMMAVAIVYGIKASRGEWVEYPIVGSIARRVLKIGPNGALFPA
ncbi:MAG: DUF4870 domain-containing protein [Acidobacteriaceae bacterium]|nr:DUF4870 domain-containing protein [Acidobacteriaceae bacterium]